MDAFFMKDNPDRYWDGDRGDYIDQEVDRMVRTIPAGYHDVILREGDLVARLREQVTQPPVNPLGLRLLLDWAADEITALRGQEG